MAAVGIGQDVGVLSVANLLYRRPKIDRIENFERDFQIIDDSDHDNWWAKSIESRVLVESLLDNIENGARFSFDYSLLLISASLIAVAGLATNNSVSVVASMLVSPLMGPILGIVYGISLKKVNLRRKGFINECLSLLICILIGVLMGLIWPTFHQIIWKTPVSWPTDEMKVCTYI